jgi:hypothetical protein
MTTDRTVALVRQAIFHVLDEGNPRTPGLAWDFNDDEQRVDFADRVVEWLAQQESRMSDTCGCLETYPQLIPGKVSHGPGCSLYVKELRNS